MCAVRKNKEGERSEVPCPKLITDYHRWTGGVNVHDQIAYKFEKYYKSLFLGLLDLALVNSYIMYHQAAASRGKDAPSREDFLGELQEELLAVANSDFAGLELPARPHPLDSDEDGYHPTECLDVQVFAVTKQGPPARLQGLLGPLQAARREAGQELQVVLPQVLARNHAVRHCNSYHLY